MSITFSSQIDQFELADGARVRRWIAAVVADASFRVLDAVQCRVGRIAYLFCDDDYMLKANIQYLNHHTLTDIITFDSVEAGVVSGDIMISIDRVRDNAQLFNVPFEHELHRVIIHGILHLLGQADKSDEDAKEMRKKEERALLLWNTIG